MVGKVSMAAVVGTLALTVSGCGAGEPKQKAAPEEPVTIPAGVSYDTLTDLRDAAVAAGYACPLWEQNDVVRLAEHSGNCSSRDVFAIYATEDDLRKQLQTFRRTDEEHRELGIDPSPRLVGQNWFISGPGVARFADALGGTVISNEPPGTRM